MSRLYKRCLVSSCPANKRPDLDVSFFSFPKKKELFIKWRENLRLGEGFTNPKYSVFLCHRHFRWESMGKRMIKWGRRRLKPDAVPTLDLGYDAKPPHAYRPSVQTKSRVKKCCMKDCASTSETERMFKFPTDPVRRQAWLEICGVAEKSYMKICEYHFDEKYLKSNVKLPRDAVPSKSVYIRPSLKRCRVKKEEEFINL